MIPFKIYKLGNHSFRLTYFEPGCTFVGEAEWEGGKLRFNCGYNETDEPEYADIAKYFVWDI